MSSPIFNPGSIFGSAQSRSSPNQKPMISSSMPSMPAQGGPIFGSQSSMGGQSNQKRGGGKAKNARTPNSQPMMQTDSSISDSRSPTKQRKGSKPKSQPFGFGITQGGVSNPRQGFNPRSQIVGGAQFQTWNQNEAFPMKDSNKLMTMAQASISREQRDFTEPREGRGGSMRGSRARGDRGRGDRGGGDRGDRGRGDRGRTPRGRSRRGESIRGRGGYSSPNFKNQESNEDRSMDDSNSQGSYNRERPEGDKNYGYRGV